MRHTIYYIRNTIHKPRTTIHEKLIDQSKLNDYAKQTQFLEKPNTYKAGIDKRLQRKNAIAQSVKTKPNKPNQTQFMVSLPVLSGAEGSNQQSQFQAAEIICPIGLDSLFAIFSDYKITPRPNGVDLGAEKAFLILYVGQRNSIIDLSTATWKGT